MTPVSLNPPPGPSIQGHTQLFISPNNQDCLTLFNILDPRQAFEFRENYPQDDKMVLNHDGSSSNNQLCNSSFISPAPVMDDPSSACDRDISLHKMDGEDGKNGHGSVKWMSSKMRLMKKMMRPSTSPVTDKAIKSTTISPSSRFQNQGYENRYSQRSPRNNGSSITRVCSDCNTSSTPLWRSGPKGPKSLCNACGIRQRKARRAMAEAANGLATPTNNAASTKTRVHNKEKKSRTNHFAQLKNKHKSSTTTSSASSEGVRKFEYFKDFTISLRNNTAFPQVFPRDEVAEAALLLMDLSCGFVHL
ncbi:putative GATA transcription factor 22 isoform X2 [Abrus precatorius]|uniref:GATA transcription factor 22 isoform X2 n=1 Tax=Abrus precatorius TaxID=3816 RepID=A0A8B8MM54_ABRPR|nr:putative GATA transcription factor 22 isoform X2 [Abrus precatorius]